MCSPRPPNCSGMIKPVHPIAGHLLVQRAREAVAAAHHLAHEGRRALARQEVARALLQQLLFFGQSEVHIVVALSFRSWSV